MNSTEITYNCNIDNALPCRIAYISSVIDGVKYEGSTLIKQNNLCKSAKICGQRH